MGIHFCCGTGGRSERERFPGVVTVLQRDGTVLEFQDPMKCSKLLESHPHHVVCLAKVMLGKEKGKVVAKDAMLERGQIYALVPRPGSSAARGGHMEFKMPKEYRAKICPEDVSVVLEPASPARSSVASRSDSGGGFRRGGSRVHAQNWASLNSITEGDDF